MSAIEPSPSGTSTLKWHMSAFQLVASFTLSQEAVYEMMKDGSLLSAAQEVGEADADAASPTATLVISAAQTHNHRTSAGAIGLSGLQAVEGWLVTRNPLQPSWLRY